MPPIATEVVRFPNVHQNPIYVDESSMFEYPVSHINENMIRARKNIETLILERNREKYLKGDKTQNLKPEKIVYPGISTD